MVTAGKVLSKAWRRKINRIATLLLFISAFPLQHIICLRRTPIQLAEAEVEKWKLLEAERRRSTFPLQHIICLRRAEKDPNSAGRSGSRKVEVVSCWQRNGEDWHPRPCTTKTPTHCMKSRKENQLCVVGLCYFYFSTISI